MQIDPVAQASRLLVIDPVAQASRLLVIDPVAQASRLLVTVAGETPALQSANYFA